jgi:hypothetical protein
MSYPNYGSGSAGFPAPTSGIGVPAQVTLSGTGVTQEVSASGTPGAPEYKVTIAEGSSVTLTAGLVDAQGNSVSAPNTFVYLSWANPSDTDETLDDNYNPSIEAPDGNSVQAQGTFTADTTVAGPPPSSDWRPNILTLSTNTVTAAEDGFGIIEVRYPLDNSTDAKAGNNFIAALLRVTVTETSEDTE